MNFPRDGKRKRPKLTLVKSDPAAEKRKKDLYEKMKKAERDKSRCDCPVCLEDEDGREGQ